MKAKILFFLVIFLGLSFSVFCQDAQDLIAQGDKLYSEMKDLETAKKALALYQKSLSVAENKYESYWKIARINYYIGSNTEKKKQKKIIFAQGIYNANRAIGLEPEKPDGHFWHGVNNGVFGAAKGVLKSLSLVKPIKKAMNKVIELNREYEDGGPDRVLGRLYFRLPGIAGGSKKKSLVHLLKSKELGPSEVKTRIYLADTYLALKEIDKAREELEYVLSLEPNPYWTADVDKNKVLAEEMLQNKKFKKKK